MTDLVTIRKIKLGGTRHTWTAHFVDEDAHGMWLFTPKGSVVHNESRDGTWQTRMGGDWADVAQGFVWLMPRTDWFFAAWWIRPDRQQIAIDACTVPTMIDGVWTWTDLELDICRDDRDRTVWVEDEDEFEESIAAGHISDAARLAARALTDNAERWLTDRVAPFDDRGWDLYAEWTSRGLPSLGVAPAS